MGNIIVQYGNSGSIFLALETGFRAERKLLKR
jgi:hypothetical protein